jgi:AcrR family transcriptional regulator
VLAEARAARDAGASRFCMGAAWRSPKDRDLDRVCAMIEGVKTLGLETCVTLGMLTEPQAQQLKAAGLDYYNHNLDTSPDFYGQIISTRTYDDLLETLEHVRAAGIHVCCGGIVGMGETRQDRIGMIQTLANLPVHPILAKDLGVTKGGFYRRFADRRALLGAMLETWARGRIAAIEQHTKLDGVSARQRLRELIRLYSETVNPRGMAVELAIRQWSRVDEAAAAVVARVDAARLKNVAMLYRALGLETEQAEAQALLFYSFIFGQSLLQMKHGARRQRELIAACSEALTAIPVGKR